jgi:hypothetical protein
MFQKSWKSSILKRKIATKNSILIFYWNFSRKHSKSLNNFYVKTKEIPVATRCTIPEYMNFIPLSHHLLRPGLLGL